MGKYRPIIVTAECGTLTRAGKILGYTQPSLGYIISNLETELGVKIFHRDQRGVRLTEVGASIIDIMRQIEQMEDHLREVIHTSQESLLRVGIFPSVSAQWMPGIIAEFRQLYPDTAIKLQHQSLYLEGELGVKERTMECAFFTGKCPAGLESIPLHEDPYFLVVGEGNEFYDREEVSIDEVVGKYPFIPTAESFDPESAIWTKVYKDFAKHNLVDFEPQENQTCMAMVESGLGVSILPELSLYDLLPSRKVRAIPLKEDISRTISLLCPAKEERSAVTSAFLQLVQRQVVAWEEEHPRM
jgi:DNA-binding transcriptional LysR family regulator